jgi:hypothetical protein
MNSHHVEATLRSVLRETLDAEHGPHPEWAGSPAAVRVAEHQRNRWPLRAIAAAAAVLLVAVVGWSGGSRPTQATIPAPAFGPAGNGVIAFEKDGDILAADRPGGDARPLVAGPDVDFEPKFSPDGTRLAFQRQTGRDAAVLMVADADGRNVVQVTPEPLFLGAWSFAPDGRSIVGVVVIDGEKRVIVRPLDPAATPTLLDIRMPGGWMHIVPPSFRPSNPQEILVVAQLEPDGPRGVYVYDLATGGFSTIVEEADGNEWLWDVEWSTTGDAIRYSLSGAPHVVATDGSGDRALDDLWTTAYDDHTGPWSNDETRVVVGRDAGEAGVVEQAIVSTDGDGEPIALACGPKTDIECAQSWIWSPDDSTLIGTAYRETPSGQFTEIYQQADPATGRVTELDWDGYGTPTWQRVAP